MTLTKVFCVLSSILVVPKLGAQLGHVRLAVGDQRLQVPGGHLQIRLLVFQVNRLRCFDLQVGVMVDKCGDLFAHAHERVLVAAWIAEVQIPFHELLVYAQVACHLFRGQEVHPPREPAFVILDRDIFYTPQAFL